MQIYLGALTVLLFYSCQEKTLTDPSCQNTSLRDAWQHPVGEQESRVEGLGQRHQGDDSPLVARDLLAIGPSSNREEMMGTASDLDLMTQGKHSDQQAESSFNYTQAPHTESQVQLTHGKPPARAAAQPQKYNKEIKVLQLQDHQQHQGVMGILRACKLGSG